jgi:hypothetical protein
VAKPPHISRTVTLMREFVSSRVPCATLSACPTSAVTYAPSSHYGPNSLPSRAPRSHLRWISPLTRTSRRHWTCVVHYLGIPAHECNAALLGKGNRIPCAMQRAALAAQLALQMQRKRCSMQHATGTRSNMAEMQNGSYNGSHAALHAARSTTSASNIPAQNTTKETQ